MRSSRVVFAAVALAVGSGLAAQSILVGAPACILAFVVCLSAPILRAPLRTMPWPLVTLPVVIGGSALAYVTSELEASLGLVLVYLQVQRSLSRVGPADDRVSIVLSGLMLALAGTRTETPWYLLVAGVWGASVPIALLYGQAESMRARLSLRWLTLPIPVWGLALVLFVFIPRLKTPMSLDPVPVADPVSTTGFADDLQLGDVGVLLDDPTEVFRVTTDAALPIYFRGIALDHFDGTRWTTSDKRRQVETAPPLGAPPDGDVAFVVDRGAVSEGVLFLPGTLQRVWTDAGFAMVDAQGSFFVDGRPLAYALHARPPFVPGAGVVAPPAKKSRRWKALPEGIDPRLASLASELGGSGPMQRAEAIRGYLLSDAFAYTRAPADDPADASPLSTFLFDRKTGHCEYYAASLAVLLRTQGVGSRIVNGFVGIERDEVTAEVVVRRAHAHSWVEVLTKEGWVAVDPTPGPASENLPALPAPAAPPRPNVLLIWWNRLLDYDFEAQSAAVVGAGRWVETQIRSTTTAGLPWLGLAVMIIPMVLATFALVWAGRRLVRFLVGDGPSAPRGRVARLHHGVHRRLERRGWDVPDALPPVDAARWVREHTLDDDGADALEALAWLYYRVHYGGEDEAGMIDEAQRLADRAGSIGPPM